MDVARFGRQIIRAVPLQARNTSGDSGELPPRRPEPIRAQLVVTAASGTSPTLNVVIEDTLDGTVWFQVGAFTQRTGAGTEAINITSPTSPYLRVRWTLGGTSPSFTFGVDLVA